jgi:hypothetical protein
VKSQPCCAIGKQWIAPLADGHIEFAWAEAPDLQLETGRNHADDRVASPIERDSFSQNVQPRAKFAIPEFRADERNGARADFVFSLRKESSDDGLYAEQWQEVRRNEFRSDLLCVARPRQVERVSARNAHARKGAVILAPVSKVREGDRSRVKIWFALGQRHELLRFGIRQRIQQHSIHDGEQCGVGADSKRQCQNRNGSKSLRFRHHAYAKTQVLHQPFE